MQIKTIKKVITTKLEEWLATISDKELRKDVKKNIVVSGGSIASLLLNVPVNDYDVYIQDQDVLVRLCKYYCNMYRLEVIDGRKAVEMEEKEFNPEQLANPEYTPSRLSLLRSLKSDQVKIVTDGYKVKAMEKVEDGVAKKYFPSFFSPNAISLTDDLQIVCRFSGTVENIHKSFDFIHATNYFTFKDGVVLNQTALESLLTKQLYYQGSLYPITSIIRAKKFLLRGWKISAGEYLKMCFQVSELDLHNPVIMEEQLVGVDIAYFGQLIEILKAKYESDPNFKLNAGYLATIIDRVFGEEGEEA
jgi:hypothetical protein